MNPVLVLQHDPTQGPGLLRAQLVRSGIPFEVLMPDHGDRIPSSAHGFSGIALLGSNRSVNDPLGWIRDEVRLVQSALELDRPLLGHCFGGQMMAKALGARVHRHSSPHIGWSRLEVTPWGRSLFQAPQVTAFNWHYETFELPARTRRLLFGRHCLNKGFALGPHLAFQCHFEVDESIVRRWCAEGVHEIASAQGPAVEAREAILREMPERMAELRRTATLVYGEWIDRVVRHSQAQPWRLATPAGRNHCERRPGPTGRMPAGLVPAGGVRTPAGWLRAT